MHRFRRWLIGSAVAAIALLGFYGWLTKDADDACLLRYAATMFREPPPLIDVTPPNCHPVARELPKPLRWRFPLWAQGAPYTVTLCETEWSPQDVWASYIPGAALRSWEARGWTPIFVGERFDGFRSGRRFILVVWDASESGGTLVATATMVQSPWSYLRNALNTWCDLAHG